MMFCSIVHSDLAGLQPRLVIRKKVPPPQPLRLDAGHRVDEESYIFYKMAPYDSDSSDGEDGDYTVTNVLLGYTSDEARDDTISHLGGRPVRSTCFYLRP